ncbi:hypothetical protein [Streptomyces sp. NPDC001404]|uniref:hypothetical protein n=1 Tax=Streptomyces sp. NPDC001404 TaxID=3364571 RepID=UPI00367C0D2C
MTRPIPTDEQLADPEYWKAKAEHAKQAAEALTAIADYIRGTPELAAAFALASPYLIESGCGLHGADAADAMVRDAIDEATRWYATAVEKILNTEEKENSA